MNSTDNSEGAHEVLVLDSNTTRFWNVKKYTLNWLLQSHSQDKFVPRPDTDPTLLVRFITPLNEHSIYSSSVMRGVSKLSQISLSRSKFIEALL